MKKSNDNDIFCSLYNISNETLNSDKILQFKFLCYKNIKYIRRKEIIINDAIKTNQTILIYFNSEPHIEFTIRNIILQLDNTWSHLIICDNNNYDFIKEIVNNISDKIKIKIVNDKNIMSNEDFWYEIDGYKLLFYDENTIIFKNIRKYLKFDYISSIYNEDSNIKNISLRNKIKIQKFFNSETIIPEYIYYCKKLVDEANVADMIETKNFNEIINNNMDINESLFKLFNKYRKTVCIISGIKGGGTLKYIKDIINDYQDYCEILVINSKDKLNNILFFDNDIILVQQLFYTDITLDDLNNIKIKYNSKIIITIHDYYWLNNQLVRKIDTNNAYWHYEYLNKVTINDDLKTFFSNSDLIIHPSKFTFNEYSKYFDNFNFKIVNHNDYTINQTKYIPEIKNNTINIGFLLDYNIYKGKEKIDLLMKKYKKYENYNINFFIKEINIIPYNQNDFYEYIDKNNIHCLTLLNKWGETYCYALTLYLNSGLPIIYNNFGSFKERIPISDHYFKVCENEYEYNNNEILLIQFENMLSYIIDNNNTFTNEQKELNYKTKLFYDYLFDKKIDLSIIHNYIKPFAIYFPQFHKIKENDINYYENMNDMMNLNKYLTETNNEEGLLKPNVKNYEINDICEYDLTNYEIIKKQIEIAKYHGMYGFGIYYYWFSENEITNDNVIMDSCYNNFFREVFNDFKVFFIWANEDWSNNPAFNSKKNIKNVYNENSFIKNIELLVIYFKHNNYYKINNSPVFYIHHPWLISEDQLKLFFELINKECKKNNLNDVILFLNSSEKIYNNFKNYIVHPNYKIKLDANYIHNKRQVIDYEKYLDYINNKKDVDVECLFFSFNNTSRLYFPNNLDLRTHTINNNIINQSKFIDITFSKYKLNNMLLINSWNEWGEDMAIEETENNNKLLNLIKFKLLNFIHQDELMIQ
jgi:hypothetical protein